MTYTEALDAYFSESRWRRCLRRLTGSAPSNAELMLENERLKYELQTAQAQR